MRSSSPSASSQRANIDDTLAHLLTKLTPRLLALADDVGLSMHRAIKSGAAILLEGAQGSLLDVDHGTYPFVTSSSTTSGGAATGTGIAPTALDAILGVVKAYTTRVGNGPLPTELEEPLASEVRTLGNEFGATTGRARRCGWFDAVVVRYAARVNGLTGLAVTKLDVLDTLDRVAVCTGYKVGEEVHETFPGDLVLLEKAVPVYEWFDGWRTSTAAARTLGRSARARRGAIWTASRARGHADLVCERRHPPRSDHWSGVMAARAAAGDRSTSPSSARGRAGWPRRSRCSRAGIELSSCSTAAPS